jgi:hypothetical protein
VTDSISAHYSDMRDGGDGRATSSRIRGAEPKRVSAMPSWGESHRFDPTHVRDRGVISSRVAIARIAQGELDGAAQIAGEALLLTTAQLHSKRALDELADVDQALTTADSSAPAVRDFHDHFTAMCAQE